MMWVNPRSQLTTVSLATLVLFSCGPSLAPGERTILSSTAENPSTSEATADRPSRTNADSEGTSTPADLKTQLIKDGQRAAQLLLSLACDDKSSQGVFAVVYALRVGLQPDTACTEDALHRGVRDQSLLIRALSWRYLLQEKEIPLPDNSLWADEAPVVRILGALAYLQRSAPMPEDLTYTLSLPGASPMGTDKRKETDSRIAHISAMAAPFDDGLLTGAVVLSESLYAKTAELSQGRTVWAAARLRGALLDALGISPEQIPSLSSDMPAPDIRPSKLAELLENQLSRNSAQTLCNIALNAPPALRIQALRALAILDGPPSPLALGAAAAALRSDNKDVRLEGARTFLLLVKRFGD